MSNLSVDTIETTANAWTGAKGQTGGATKIKVTGTFNGMSIGGNVPVDISGDAWTAKVIDGDGNFTPPGKLVVTAEADGEKASKTKDV